MVAGAKNIAPGVVASPNNQIADKLGHRVQMS